MHWEVGYFCIYDHGLVPWSCAKILTWLGAAEEWVASQPEGRNGYFFIRKEITLARKKTWLGAGTKGQGDGSKQGWLGSLSP